MTALEFLKCVRDEWKIPLHSTEGKGVKQASNMELRRWLEKGYVEVNWKRPKPTDEITYPIKQLVIGPDSNKRRTVVWND